MSAEGATIGTYRLLHKLGEGGMGVVYVGEHTLLGRRAAIKVLRPSLTANEETLKRFFNEARAVTRIADPGIVQIFDFGHNADGSAFIVMELLHGEAMDRRLKRIRRFGLFECVRLVRLICSSLGVVHAKGIVHRDLKPGNIFLVSDPAVTGGERVKILDFGIAKLSGDEPGEAGELTRTGVLLGTPMYMSPEQCRGSGGGIDHRSDIYTMGCVMFAMLTGRPPFPYKASGEQIAAHLREPPPLASVRIPEIPPAIDQLIDRCLRKSPDERFQSMAEVMRALDAAERTLEGSSAAAGVQGSAVPLEAAALPQTLVSTAPGRGEPPAPATHTLPAPTTLHDASGQAAATPVLVRRRRDRSSRRWLTALVAGAVAALGVILVSVSGGGDASLSPPPPGDAAEPLAGASALDAAPAAEPSRAPTPPDAGAADAALAAEASDAAVRSPVRPSSRPKPSGKGPVQAKGQAQSKTEGDHALSTGSAEPVIDRGD